MILRSNVPPAVSVADVWGDDWAQERTQGEERYYAGSSYHQDRHEPCAPQQQQAVPFRQEDADPCSFLFYQDDSQADPMQQHHDEGSNSFSPVAAPSSTFV